MVTIVKCFGTFSGACCNSSWNTNPIFIQIYIMFLMLALYLEQEKSAKITVSTHQPRFCEEFKRSFPFDGLCKNNWKIHISIVFVHDLSENQLHYFEKWAMKNYELLKLLISYVFVKKNIFFSILQCLYRGYQAVEYKFL